MDYKEFSAKIKNKYPGAYDDMSDEVLARKMIAKYPQYSDVTFEKESKPSISSKIRTAANIAAAPFPQGRIIGKAVSDIITKPDETVEMASPALATTGLFFGGIPGSVAGGSLGKGYEIAAKKLLKSDRPTDPQFFGARLPAIPGIPKPASDVAVEGIAQLIPEGVVRSLKGAARFPASKVGKKLANVFFGPDGEAIERMAKRPAQVKAAPSFSEIADDMPKTIKKLSDKITQADNEAWKTLRTSRSPSEGALAKNDLIKKMQDLKNSFKVQGGGAASDADSLALKKIDTQIARLKSISPESDYISESQTKQFIQNMGGDINWKDPAAKSSNKALIAIRSGIDRRLKGQNELYKGRMVPVAKMTELLENTKSDFSIEQFEDGFKRGNTTPAKIKAIMSDRKDISRETLKNIEQITGDKILERVEDAAAKLQFSGGKTQGSRMVNMGRGVGSFAGGALGAVLSKFLGVDPITAGGMGSLAGMGTGAVLGGVVDKQGGPVLSRLMDLYRQNNPRNISPIPATTMMRLLSAKAGGGND